MGVCLTLGWADLEGDGLLPDLDFDFVDRALAGQRVEKVRPLSVVEASAFGGGEGLFVIQFVGGVFVVCGGERFVLGSNNPHEEDDL